MANWRTELHRLSRRDPELGHETDALSEAIHTAESDRGAALIAGSVAENAITQILTIRLVPMSQDARDSLFGFDAPLGTFSAKIRVAYAFGFIDAEIRDDLDRIREIRNCFAHSQIPLNFSTDPIPRACAGFGNAFPGILRQHIKDNPRQLYIHTCLTMVVVANEVLRHFNRRHTRVVQQTLTYAPAVASRDKYLTQLLEQTLANPPSENT
jgi:hypothetical protein